MHNYTLEKSTLESQIIQIERFCKADNGL